MSDAIREAFEALERVGNYASVPFEMMVQFADDLDTVKAALQSQTAPAVPEGAEPPTWTAEGDPVAYLTWHQVRHAIDDYEEVVALAHKDDRSADGTPAFPVYTRPAASAVREDEYAADILEQARRLQEAQYGPSAQALSAAPQPDHIGDAGKVAFVDGLGAQRLTAEECREGIEYIIHGDNIYWPLSDDDELRLIQAACGKGEFTYPGATPSVPEEETGKVVQGEPVAFGYVDPDVYSKGSVGGGISKTPTDTRTLAVYTHPAESREEIQAQALESYADQLDVVFANAQRAGANDCPAWHAGQFAKDARKQAARIRASQQECNTVGDDGEGRS